ncbi:putative ABC transporter permease subunit [Clostridium sp. Marseille-Q7071]
MNKIYTLTKVLIKNGNQNYDSSKKRNKFDSKLIAFLLLSLILCIPIGYFASSLYQMLETMNKEYLLISFSLSFVNISIILFSFTQIITTFYYSNDIDKLLPLPLKPNEILCSKFVSVLIYQYSFCLILFLPFYVVYGIRASMGLAYYIYGVIIFTFTPIIPLVISSIIIMVIMSFTNLSKHKDRFKTISGIIAILFFFLINIGTQIYSRVSNSTENISNIIKNDNNSILNILYKVMFQIEIVTNSIINSGNAKGFLNILLFIGSSIAFFLIFMFLANRLYLKGIVGGSESFSKEKKLTLQNYNKALRKNSPIKSYVIKELKIIFRTPAYVTNCVVYTLLFPLLFIVPLMIDNNISQLISEAKVMMSNTNDIGIILGSITLLFLLQGGSNIAATSSISREGENIIVAKYIPISYKLQILSKVISSVIINGLSILAILIFFIILLTPPPVIIVLSIIIAILILFYGSMLGVYINLKNPNLFWDDESKVVSKNRSLTMLNFINLIFLVAYAIFVFLVNPSLLLWTIVTLGIFIILNIILYKKLCNKGVKRFSKLLNN